MSQLERINIWHFAKAWLLLFPIFLVYHSIRSEEYLPGPEAGTSIFSLSPRQRCDIKRVDFFPNRRRRRDLRLCHKPPMNSTATRSEALRWKTVSTFISTDWISLKEATMTNNSKATVEEFKVDDDNDGFVPLHSLMCQWSDICVPSKAKGSFYCQDGRWQNLGRIACICCAAKSPNWGWYQPTSFYSLRADGSLRPTAYLIVSMF